LRLDKFESPFSIQFYSDRSHIGKE